MDAVFKPYIHPLEQHIKKVFKEKGLEYKAINGWGKDVTERMGTFATQGKLLRGALVFVSAKLFELDNDDDIMNAATAIEIIHSSLLIHDDIMDQDIYRRGQISIHTQYTQQAEYLNREQPEHKGISLGICAGDLGFFIACELLAKLQSKHKQAVLNKITSELAVVGLAQMQDVMPYGRDEMGIEDIIRVYQFKTGRYSISLPLVTGAMLAGADEKTITLLEEFGESVGIVFQIVDDRLGLFGTIEQTGKPIGSDIRDDKKTLYRALLFQYAAENDRKLLLTLFGNKHLILDNLNVLKSLIQKYSVEEKIHSTCEMYRTKAQNCVQNLPISDTDKKLLIDLVEHLEKRIK